MILALDAAIPYWEIAFSGLGNIRPFSGRNLDRKTVLDADALIVRSITPVEASLLEGTRIRFVGAASAGIDHVDLRYLQDRKIRFAYAPGCNANSVSEYITVALGVMASRRGWTLKDKSLAVIGVGHVGSRVVEKARALGMKVLLCDPPLREQTGNRQYQDFESVLGADILTFHVPLVHAGKYPTLHMLDTGILERLSPGQVVINASRGAVFDNGALKEAVRNRRIEGAVLDVWEGEPQIDYSLLDNIDLGTPHIAGSSLDGKIRATEMVAAALHDFFDIPNPWNGESQYAEPEWIRPEPGCSGQDAILSVLLKAYNIIKDDENLRKLGSASSRAEANAGFDRLRSEYVYRPEFRHFIVPENDRSVELNGFFKALGFQVRQGAVI